MKINAKKGIEIPAQTESNVANRALFIDGADNKFKFKNESAVSTPVVVGTVGTGANNIVALNGSSQIPAIDGSLITSVNAAQLGGKTVGTGANNIVALDGSSKLPAVDASNLTNIPSGGGVSEIGTVIMHCPTVSGAVSIATLRTKGWATADGTTATSQGISSATIENTPDMRQKFIRGSNSSTSGATGGADTHGHGAHPTFAVQKIGTGGSYSSDMGHLHPDASSLPAYYEVVYLIKVK